jgi:TolB-like protein/Tfp pilus assembly protein PilF
MTNFFAELRRRHIYRVGAAYVVVAWGITQVIDVMSQIWALPAWIAQPVTLVLAIGLPVTLIVAWLIEGKAPEAVASAMRSPASTIDYALFAAMAVVIGLIGYQQFAPSTVTAVNATASAVADEIVQDIADRLPNSIAVLPFENLSPDPDDAYFAAGIHDEILNKLSKIRSLAVIARGSVMRYAGTAFPIPQIAQELNVEMVMTGTVRYAGDQVRVTAELIDGMTNLPVWTTEDEGDLSDIFAIQSDIAMSIANSLQAQFSTAEQESVEVQPTDSPGAYRFYLRALALAGAGFRGSGLAAIRAAIQEFLDQAIRLDPEFAMAYAWKAHIYASSKSFDVQAEENVVAFRSEMDRLIVENANTALALDPSVGLAHTALAQMYGSNGEQDMALAEAEEALRLSPNDSEAVGLAANMLGGSGNQSAQAIALLQGAVQRDPNNALVHRFLGGQLLFAGRFDEAAASYQKCLDVGTSTVCAQQLAAAELLRGNEEAALDAVRYGEQITNGGTNTTATAAYLYSRLGLLEEARRSYEELSELAREAYVAPLQWAIADMGVGDYDAAYSVIAENLEIVLRNTGAAGHAAIRDNFLDDPVLEEPRWVELRNQMNAQRRAPQ